MAAILLFAASTCQGQTYETARRKAEQVAVKPSAAIDLVTLGLIPDEFGGFALQNHFFLLLGQAPSGQSCPDLQASTAEGDMNGLLSGREFS